MTKIKSLADVDREVNKAYNLGKIDLLKELITIYKPRDPLDIYTTNVILLELEVRLRVLTEPTCDFSCDCHDFDKPLNEQTPKGCIHCE